MRCRLFLEADLRVGHTITLPDAQAHYLRNVMRLAAGDHLILFNGAGGEFHTRIEQLNRKACICQLESFADVDREMACRVHVVQAACRSEKIETVLQKGTELGAASFQIVRSERSALKLERSKLERRVARWMRIIEEAAEQSGRTAVPALFWRDSLQEMECRGMGLTLHPEAGLQWHSQRSAIATAAEMTLAIGPEGGWSERDLATLQSIGLNNIGFGPRVMRTETAAPALLAAIQAVEKT